VLSVAFLAIARPDLTVSDDPMSEYVHGPYSYVQVAVFFVIALSSALFARRLWCVAGGSWRSRVPAILLSFWAVGIAVAGCFDAEDRVLGTGQGAVHNAAVTVAFVMALLAMALRRDGPAPTSRLLRANAPVWTLVTGIALVATAILADRPGFGLAERFLAAVVVAWLITTGQWLMSAIRDVAPGD
jgi:hypothetical protein